MPRDAQGHLVPGRISPRRPVPAGIARPEYVDRPEPRPYRRLQHLHARRGRADPACGLDRRASRRGRRRRRRAPASPPRNSTRSRTSFSSRNGHTRRRSAIAAFPKSCCTSVNEVVCHGIPDDTVLLDGDLVNVDITAFVDGMHGDLNKTFIVGNALREVIDSRRSHPGGAEPRHQGRRPGPRGQRDRTRHRVIRQTLRLRRRARLHRTRRGRRVPLRTDHPALRLGPRVRRRHGGRHGVHDRTDAHPRHSEHPGSIAWDQWDDDWTVTTRDKSLTAQFEHTLVVTERGADILTLP